MVGKENKNKASDGGGEIEKQQDAIQVSVCKIALCVYMHLQEKLGFENRFAFSL